MSDPIVFRGLTQEEANATAKLQADRGATTRIVPEDSDRFSVEATFPVTETQLNLSSIPAGKRPIAQLIAQKFAEAGFGLVQQAAAIGNAMRESSLDPGQRTITSHERSFGLFQLNTQGGVGEGHSEAELLDPVTNIEITIANVQRVPTFVSATNVEDAVTAFVRGFERPANPDAEIVRRLEFARPLLA